MVATAQVRLAVLTVAPMVVAGGLALASVRPSSPSTVQATSGSELSRPTRDVLANLFEWNWPSVGRECRDVLGPAGYGGVQVAPPQDSVKRTSLGNGSDTILHPWWEVYQPVDYNLTSRMGSEQQFKDMVKTCRAAGVKVYVDAVINHMTGQGSVSYGGVSYSHFAYPGVYSAADFHQKGPDCTSASGGIEDFNNLIQVRTCELVGLSDLRTESRTVRNTIAAYLNKLIGYGVSGFRVDAAKHIGQADLAAIESKLHRTKDGARPYIALEVFGGGPGVLAPAAFQGQGSLLGLDADRQLQAAFKSYPAEHLGSLATLKVFGVDSGLVPGNHALTFVQNHDTERNGDALNYKDPNNVLANQFLLAYGYGRPQVYSGFTWTTSDDSPPSNPDGTITDTNCAAGTWACVDRDPGVVGLVAFHNAVGHAPVANWWDDGANVIAFSRGGKGFFAANNNPTVRTVTVRTGLRQGIYANLVGTGKVTVGSDGKATITVPAFGAVAFTV